MYQAVLFCETNHRAILGRLVRRHKRGTALGEIGRPGEAQMFGYAPRRVNCNADDAEGADFRG
jgi:hypothetical protein